METSLPASYRLCDVMSYNGFGGVEGLLMIEYYLVNGQAISSSLPQIGHRTSAWYSQLLYRLRGAFKVLLI